MKNNTKSAEIESSLGALRTRHAEVAQQHIDASGIMLASQTALVSGKGDVETLTLATAREMGLAGALDMLETQISDAESRLSAARADEQRAAKLSQLKTIADEGAASWKTVQETLLDSQNLIRIAAENWISALRMHSDLRFKMADALCADGASEMQQRELIRALRDGGTDTSGIGSGSHFSGEQTFDVRGYTLPETPDTPLFAPVLYGVSDRLNMLRRSIGGSV